MKHRFRQPPAAGPLLTLRQGAYELTVAPGFGARIVSFRHASRNVMRPTPHTVLAEPIVYGFAGFPLMPYSGPLFGPGFAFAGLTYSLDRTVREEPTATHGDAWIAHFRIAHREEAELTLEMDHEPEPGTFPFRFRAHIRYSLSESGLSLFLRLTSRVFVVSDPQHAEEA
jgi:galactose mutarotase-like enzyme